MPFEWDLETEIDNLYREIQTQQEQFAMQIFAGMHLGIIEWYDASMGVMKVKDEEWAPGIWAGTEGATFEWEWPDSEVKGTAIVTAVDLVGKTITIIPLTPLLPQAGTKLTKFGG